MKKKIIGILVCMLLIATALPAVGMIDTGIRPQKLSETKQGVLDQSQERDDECKWSTSEVIMPVNQEPTGLFGWVFLRGFVFNPRENESFINARAINLHYFEISPQGVHNGVVRFKKVSFRNGIFIKMSEKGLLGNIVYISGFCHGGIEIQ